MGTTVVAMRFGGTEQEPVAEISHVGDSRAYLLRDGDLRPVTEDHSLVAELVRSGDLTRDEATEHPQKNLITRALGAEEEVEVDTTVLPIRAGDRLLLCSDGLSDMVPESKMLALLASSPEDPERAARDLLAAALDAGGADNVTVVVVDVNEENAPAEEPRRGDTQEMMAIAPDGPRRRERPRSRGTRGKRAASRAKKSEGLRRVLEMLVRALAVVLVLTAAATPVYLWGSTRYFLGFGEGEVVIYRGLPYAPLGYELNVEARRTDLKESEVQPRYREPIDDHKLYSSEEQAEEVVSGLESSRSTSGDGG
jgi:protein phosphatase